MTRFLRWLLAVGAGAAAAVAMLSALAYASNAGGAGLRVDVGFSAFTLSLFPALALAFATLLVAEMVGLRPNVLLFAALAAAGAFAGLSLFVAVVYEYPASFAGVFSEWPLAVSLAAAGAVYAGVRGRLNSGG